ncbi:ankyrin repeat domain-containing protein 31 isoform X1 [Mus musculus]|uniref:Ankyrin repeat domain-containing protein 31 n=1 Tax=Mus musculus TaxID=10090 RepID=ANR31_MOUSE|nr:ankyrin repeat domain-containing protein 31 [Mus musculus]XP_030103201.1 ankyrin repeat domain-containing protein 31 isoform X1 [Mus musculus]A0A140LI88.2 RecName: Full=Ankyrin repeat domain-containing protein 31 [Mus musculus]|eukprot:XP_006517860.1 PREDICTED: putative ankyrin repeat domain-containing protein 31 [Mus musculus]
MENGAEASDCDSDETVIEGSVTENEPEDEELPWRRLLLNQDTTCRSEFCFHSGVDGMQKGIHSPEIQLGLKLRKDSQEQNNKNKLLLALSEDLVLQDPQDKTAQNQVLLQTTKEFPVFTVSFPHPEVSWSHQNTGGHEAENCENLPHSKKELRENSDSPEVSLLSGTSPVAPDLVALKERLTEPVKTLAVPNTLSEPGEEVTQTMTSKETKDEESSLETFVSTLEKLLESSECTQEERLLEVMDDFNPQELFSTLSNSLGSVSVPLNAWAAQGRDELENKADAALPAKLLAAVNTGADVGPSCQGQEKSSSVSGGNGCLAVQPIMSQVDEDCTQIAQNIEDPKPFRLQTLTHENAISYEQINKKKNSDPIKNTSTQETPRVLRRSSRLEKLKASRDVVHTEAVLKKPERILSNTLSFKDQINSIFTTDSFSKRKNMHSSGFKNEQIRKSEQLRKKNGTGEMKKMCLCTINRRNVFGENLLYKAALHNDVDLVRCCIKNGENVNQPSYDGWTALHEASIGGYYQAVSELLKGGADVNVKGKYQITPLHDAVMNRHYKVAELLLMSGADPLFRSDHGTCALDEAKDSSMETLLMKYIPQQKKCHLSAQRNSTDPAHVEDMFQNKKPKLSSNNYTEFICDENFDRQEPGHLEINKGSNNLLMSKEYVCEHCQKDSNTTKFGKSNLNSVKNSRTNVSKRKGQKNRQQKKTQVDDRDCNLSQKIGTSSFRRTNKLLTQQQHAVQTLSDLPEESFELSTTTLSSLENGIGYNEACLVSKKSDTHVLDSSDGQELESVDQTEAASVSELSSYKEIKLLPVTTHQQPHTNQEQYSSPYKSLGNNSSNEKGKATNKWEDSFFSFIKGRSADSDSDCHTLDKSIASPKEGMSHDHHEEIMTGQEVDSQQRLSSENYFSQENDLKVHPLTTHPQEEAVNFCDSNLISVQHTPDYKNCLHEISFGNSYAKTEQSSTSCTRPPSTQKVSPLTVEVELLKGLQDSLAHRDSSPLVNQAGIHSLERKQDTDKNYTKKGPNTSSSSRPLPTVVHSQVIEITKAEKRREDLPGNEPINNTDFYSTDINKELANSSQLNQRKEKENVRKSDAELTHNDSEAERTLKSCEEKKKNMDSETHSPCDIQEHRKDQNFRKRKCSLKAPCSQGVNTTGIGKRNKKGESQLHVAARGGNLSRVKVLIEARADVNLRDNAGWTPLHKAASGGFDDVIIELLQAGANVNCENIDGIVPLHGASAGNHLKAAEILLEHGANPNQKDQKQRTALDEADDEKMKELLKSYGAIESTNGEKRNSTDLVKIPTVQPKRYKQFICDNDKAIGSPVPSHKAKKSESLPVHQTISAILQDIEEKQENLLKLEIRNSEDEEQYIGKMLEIKEVMDNILAQQKTERDDLAKKYRVSMESFKHGALREQLANLATRQKSLLVVAKKQKKIRLKIQNYKNATAVSGVGLRKLPCNSDISSDKKSQEPPTMGDSAHAQPGLLAPVSLAYGSMQEIPLSPEIESESQKINICLNAEAIRREEFSGNDINSKQNVQDCTLGGLLRSKPTDDAEKIASSSQPAALTPHAENSQAEATVKGCGFDSSALTGTINISEDKSIFSPNGACLAADPHSQKLSRCNPKRRNKKTASQQPSAGAAEPLPQAPAVLDTYTVHQTLPCLRDSAAAASHTDSTQSSLSSASAHQHPTKTVPHRNTTPRKKAVQLKDLILRGRINPGNNILEFKTQETTHRASVLPSGKLKGENGQIYQNPVTWLKELLGGGSYVTWNYAWNTVTYLGRELVKCVSEEAPMSAELNPPQLHQPHLSAGTSRESMQTIPHYLQIKEILQISKQELLPCHVMEQHWKFYVGRSHSEALLSW